MKNLNLLKILGLCFYLSGCQLGYTSPSLANANNEEKLRTELKQIEQQNSPGYITGNYESWRNLMGQYVIVGTLTNAADLSTFKDIALEITFMSKTETVLDVQNHTVYESVGPKRSVLFKVKTDAPPATESYSVRIINAIPVGN